MKLNDLPTRAIGTSMLFAADANAVSSAVMAGDSLLYTRVKPSVAPFGMPAPHSDELVPGDSQVMLPLTGFQPCEVSSDFAAEVLYAYTGLVAFDGANGLCGTEGTGPSALAA